MWLQGKGDACACACVCVCVCVRAHAYMHAAEQGVGLWAFVRLCLGVSLQCTVCRVICL